MDQRNSNGSPAQPDATPGPLPAPGSGPPSPVADGPRNPAVDGGPILLSILLFALVVWVFLPSIRNGFIDVDDAGYISDNIHVRHGFTWAGMGWAFANSVGGSWHPLTWFSLMLDCQLFGLRPAGHHLTGLLLHAANTVLLFLLFRRLTGATRRSALVALLFALHPLRVESVAWAAERKDVLSTFFFMLTLLAYVRYAEKAEGRMQNAETRSTLHAPRSTHHTSRYYALALLFFVCGLMSKPMVVTLPFILLLLDFWPLGRLSFPSLHRSTTPPLRLLREKLPFFLLGFLICVLTLHSQREFGALSALSDLTISDRLVNATLSYGRYLVQMVWPAQLAPFYPLPRVFPLGPAVGVALLLIAASLLALRAARTRPYLAFGWIWYLVTLLPVIGLIQVGHQSHADRYTYLPLIGVCTLCVWGAHDLTRRWPYQPLFLSALALAVTLPCIALTRRQLGYWKNSETLFRHALAVTENNELADDILGTLLVHEGRLDEGILHLRAALKLAPAYARAHNDLGAALGQQGHEDEALAEFGEALRLNPKLAEAHRNLGFALEKQGRLDEAIDQFRAAANLKPDFADAHRKLGVALGKLGRLDESIDHLTQAVTLAPDDAEAQSSLGITLGKLGRLDEAITHLEAALKLKPDNAEAHCNLGVALGAKGQLDDAIRHLQAALKLKPGYADARNNLRIALDLKSAAGQPPAPPKP